MGQGTGQGGLARQVGACRGRAEEHPTSSVFKALSAQTGAMTVTLAGRLGR